MTGIVSLGVHLPRLRLERRTIADAMAWLGGPANVRGERTACNWDEDSLTMGVEAARAAVAAAGVGVGRLSFASTTFPFDDRSNAGILATAIGLDPAVRSLDLAGSQHAGTGALAQALTESAAAGSRPALVVAADRRLARPGSEQERRYGHGAAAFVVDPGDGIARFDGARHLTADFVDHYRSAGDAFDYALEERWVREAGWFDLVPRVLRQLLEDCGVAGRSIDRLVVPAPAAIARRVASDAGIAPEAVVDALDERCGHTGCAHALVLLAAALEQASPGERILVVGFGQGVDALLFTTTPAIASRPPRGVAAALARRRSEPSYARFLSHCGLLPVDFGRRAERDNRTAQSVLWRKSDAITAFTGGRCRDCGTVQFPRARVCVNPACRRSDTQDPHRLAESAGRIKTFTEDWLAYSARPPLVYGNVAFAEGGNAFIEFTDFEPGEAAVGDAVRFVFRLKDVDRTRGFRRYFWKAAPAEAS